jgi:hypothetical protein
MQFENFRTAVKIQNYTHKENWGQTESGESFANVAFEIFLSYHPVPKYSKDKIYETYIKMLFRLNTKFGF